MKVTTIGIDLAKDVFGLHGVDGEGRVTFKRRLVRSRLLEFLSQLPRCSVGLEACSSAHYWAREIERLAGCGRTPDDPEFLDAEVRRRELGEELSG